MPVRVVTPDMARQIMETSGLSEELSQRSLSKENVVKLKSHIVNGDWKTLVNPGVFVNDAGFVMNGQHTLQAIVAADQSVPVQTFFGSAEGATPDLMPYFDTGKSRSAADLMSINGVGNSTLMAAGSKILYAYYSKNPSAFSKSPLSNNDLFNFYQDNIGIRRNAYKASQLNQEPGIKSSIALAFLYAADPNNESPDVLDMWFDGLNKNVGLVLNDPRTALIRRIANKKQTKAIRPPKEESIEYIKCWNAWVSDAQIVTVKVGSKEGLPTILPASNKVIPPSD